MMQKSTLPPDEFIPEDIFIILTLKLVAFGE